MPISDDNLTIDRFSFSVRLKSVIFPFSIEELIPGLENLGYHILPEIESVLIPGVRPAGSRLRVNGGIAQKDEPALQVRTNMERGILSVDGKAIDAVIEDYSKLEKWIDDELVLQLRDDAVFYEIILEGTLNVGRERNPIETSKRLYSDSVHLSKFGGILEREVASFGIRLVEQDRQPTGEVWLDVRIDPSVLRSTSSYHVNVVSRGPNLEAQVEEAKHWPEKIGKLVAAMEEEN